MVFFFLGSNPKRYFFSQKVLFSSSDLGEKMLTWGIHHRDERGGTGNGEHGIVIAWRRDMVATLR